jgi:hypothetical protein
VVTRLFDHWPKMSSHCYDMKFCQLKLWNPCGWFSGVSSTYLKTVERALHAARDLGLITWSERRLRRGWRWLRTSNLYQLTTPDAAVEPGPPRTRRTNRPPVERGESKQSSRLTREAWTAVPVHITRAARDGLAAIAAARMQALGIGAITTHLP